MSKKNYPEEQSKISSSSEHLPERIFIPEEFEAERYYSSIGIRNPGIGYLPRIDILKSHETDFSFANLFQTNENPNDLKYVKIIIDNEWKNKDFLEFFKTLNLIEEVFGGELIVNCFEISPFTSNFKINELKIKKVKFASLGEVLIGLGSVAGLKLIFDIIKYYVPNKNDIEKRRTINLDNNRKEILNKFLNDFVESEKLNATKIEKMKFLTLANGKLEDVTQNFEKLISNKQVVDVETDKKTQVDIENYN